MIRCTLVVSEEDMLAVAVDWRTQLEYRDSCSCNWCSVERPSGYVVADTTDEREYGNVCGWKSTRKVMLLICTVEVVLSLRKSLRCRTNSR